MAGKSLSNRTTQGFGLHPALAQRLDSVFKSLDEQKAAIETVGANSITTAQAQKIASQTVQNALALTTNPGANVFNFGPPTQLYADGPVQTKGGNFVITKAAVLTATLGPPSAPNGTPLLLYSATPFAHSVTTTGYILPGLLLTGTAATQGAHYAAHPGAGMMLMAYNNVWIVVSFSGITFF